MKRGLLFILLLAVGTWITGCILDTSGIQYGCDREHPYCPKGQYCDFEHRVCVPYGDALEESEDGYDSEGDGGEVLEVREEPQETGKDLVDTSQDLGDIDVETPGDLEVEPPNDVKEAEVHTITGILLQGGLSAGGGVAGDGEVNLRGSFTGVLRVPGFDGSYILLIR